MQYEINVHHHQLLSHHVQQMVLTGVADSRSLCSDKLKLQFSQNVLCGMPLLCGPVCGCCVNREPDHGSTALNQVQQSLWGSRTSHPFDFNGGMTRKIISTFRLRLAQPAIATWARKRSPRLKSSTPYCSLVVSTPDVHR